MGSEYPDAIDMFVDTGRTFVGAKPRGAIVLHKTAGFSTPEECANYFATTDLRTSSHFIIGLDGRVVQCVSLNNGAAANCCLGLGYDPYWDQYGKVNLNLVTISIEHIDPLQDNSTQPPVAQIMASVKLCLWLRDNYNMQAPDVKTHASIDPVTRARCPGNYPINVLLGYMNGSIVDPKSTPTPKVPSKYQDVSFHNQWAAVIPNIRTNTGIYKEWVQKKLDGIEYNAPTSNEYTSINWNGTPIMCQDGGNWHAEFYPHTGICEFFDSVH